MPDAPNHIQPDLTSQDNVNLHSLVAAGALHEIFSAKANDAAAAACFALGLLRPGLAKDGQIFWLRQELAQLENGSLYAPGLATLGLDPSCVTFLTLRDVNAVLQAGLEASRTKGLGAVIIELWGMAKPYTLTASRKLSLAAKDSGVKICLLAHAASPLPSAAETRWQVKRLPSLPLAGHAPGFPCFEVGLLRQRSGAQAGQVWSVEWDYEERCFKPRKKTLANSAPLFKPVVMSPPLRENSIRSAA